MSIRDQSVKMVDAFQGTYIIQANVDVWGFPPKGWHFYVIPYFYALDAMGVPTGDVIDGGAWGDNIPGNMAPPLKEFFESLRG